MSVRGHARPQAPDQAERDRAVAERRLNVLVDAGAGTGKTDLLVQRLVEMVAPTGAGPAVPIHRLAAITFTRKAAGELRLRIRESLLRALAAPGLPADRERALRDALAGLDTAWVGTIHGFADRLLRLCPVEAELSPSYAIAEDDEPLVRETVDVLLHAVQNATLGQELAGTRAAALGDEAAATVVLALGTGVRAESRELEWRIQAGLDALVAGFLRQRDVPPAHAPPATFDAAAFRAAAEEFVHRARGIGSQARGARWLRRMADQLGRLGRETDPYTIRFRLHQVLGGKPPGNPGKAADFGDDPAAWALWQAWQGKSKQRPVPLRDDLLGPLDRWLATRLVGLFPVAVALYERVKARRRALDQLDLLVKLRDLLRDRPDVRARFQAMFDHVFVDEFQDTDPLQAEIALYLCERLPRARSWDEVELRAGVLTLVGDPKQSVYRFRRADIALYDRVRALVARQPHLPVTLSASFRSLPPLISWLNDRFARVLGSSEDGRPFDPATGRVFHQPLLPGRTAGPDDQGPAVHVLPFDFGDALKHTVDEYRALEGKALARYLRWLTTSSGLQVTDPLDGGRRPVQYADVAILAVSTWALRHLLRALDAEGIPHASRGGTLFLSDSLHRLFLLGLRAVADRDDGVAEAALLRPPFFAVDPRDLLQEQVARRAGQAGATAGAGRAAEARALVQELRRQRLDRPPGATARDLLELTALGRTVARGPNGAQRLARLRELCLLLEAMAAAEGLDYDAVTARLRDWVEEPVQLDPARPVGADAVEVLTVHQAKGLEYPVVVLWDGRGEWRARVDSPAWRMERDGCGWSMTLDGLRWEEPAGLGLRDTEKHYLDAERRRLVYVAATRARDLLVVPRAGDPRPGTHVAADLLQEAPSDLVRELPPYRPGAEPGWARAEAAVPTPAPADGASVSRDVQSRWEAAAGRAALPRWAPAAVTAEAHAAPAAPDEEGRDPAAKPREGRLGAGFGHTVHLAIGLALAAPGLSPQAAVERAARRTGLAEHLPEAAADVGRALAALAALGLPRALGPDLRVEYPVAGPGDGGGLLLSGYADLVAVAGPDLIVLDFKTDSPPAGPVAEAYPAYAAQARSYGRLLEAAGAAPGRRVRPGLLFTADGAVRWV